MNDLFETWKDHPPTHILVRALVEGFGGIRFGNSNEGEASVNIPPEAQKAMQDSVLSTIAVKAGPRLPIMRGRDPGLPKAAPVFDLAELRQRNADALRKRVASKEAG